MPDGTELLLVSNRNVALGSGNVYRVPARATPVGLNLFLSSYRFRRPVMEVAVAGVTMAAALVSELTRRPVRGDVAMTGEVTLSGRVLPVGGIKEKVLAAKRAGIREIILPRQNEKNVKEDLDEELRAGLTIHLVGTIDEVLLLALVPVRPPAGKRAARRVQPGMQ
jgi:predicted ATP-dependent protease